MQALTHKQQHHAWLLRPSEVSAVPAPHQHNPCRWGYVLRKGLGQTEKGMALNPRCAVAFIVLGMQFSCI